MVNIEEKELKKAISYLSRIRKEKKSQGIKVDNLEENILYLRRAYEEQRMMNNEETNEMVDWAEENVE